MYSHPLFIALSLVFVTLAPVLYISSYQKRKARKNLQKFNVLAQANNLKFDATESLPLVMLGLAASAGKLLVVEVRNADRTTIFDLRDFSSCEIQTIRSKSGGIDRINLLLEPKHKTGKQQQILLYDEILEVHPNADVRTKSATRWKELISQNIKLNDR